MCRVCRTLEGDGELVPIFERSNKLSMGIYIISGIQISENLVTTSVSALICIACIKELSRALKFRHRCRETDDFLKKSLEAEVFTLNESRNDENELSDYVSPEGQSVKDEPSHTVTEERMIKDEPADDINLELYEHIDTILEENLGIAEDSNDLTRVPKRTKRDTFSDQSEDGSESEVLAIMKNKSKAVRKCSEPDESDLMQTNGLAQCNLCYKSFTSIHSFKDHMRCVHQQLDEADMFKCPHCDRLFKMKYYLNRHIKSYHIKDGKKKEKCSKVKSKFEGDEIFKEKLVGLNCPYCNKFLTSKHSLNDHIRVRHEYINYSERFLCDICGKGSFLLLKCESFTDFFFLRFSSQILFTPTHPSFTPQNALVQEKVSHFSGNFCLIKPMISLFYFRNEDHLPCSICGKILKSKGNLSTHEKTHRVLSPDDYWYCVSA